MEDRVRGESSAFDFSWNAGLTRNSLESWYVLCSKNRKASMTEPRRKDGCILHPLRHPHSTSPERGKTWQDHVVRPMQGMWRDFENHLRCSSLSAANSWFIRIHVQVSNSIPWTAVMFIEGTNSETHRVINGETSGWWLLTTDHWTRTTKQDTEAHYRWCQPRSSISIKKDDSFMNGSR